MKFYASIRLEVRKTEALKNGTEVVGSRTKVKVVKNKVAPPFKQAEFDILYGLGISKEGSLIDIGVELNPPVIAKSGAWFSYGDQRIGQGKENARDWLRQHPDVAAEVERKIKERLMAGAIASRGISAAAGDDDGGDE